MSSSAIMHWTASDEDENESGAVLMSALRDDPYDDDTSQLLNYRVESRSGASHRSRTDLSSSALERVKEERKYKYSLVSILVIGVCLLLMVNIGLGYRKCEGDEHNSVQAEEPTQTVCRDRKTNVVFPWQKYRLPTLAAPQDYRIFLHPNLTTQECKGHVNISLTILKDTNHIIIHSGQNVEINIAFLLSGDDFEERKEAMSILRCYPNEMLALKFADVLKEGSQYLLHINFSYKLEFSLDGFYLSSYTKANGDKMVIAATQFESVFARRAFPCFDEPAYKANISLKMVREKHYHTLFNMPVKSSKPFGNNLELDEFFSSPKMSTYLTAFIVSDFVSISNTTSTGVKVSVYASRDKTNQTTFALDTAIKVLEYYEQRFQIPFPLDKMDLAAIPDFDAGAMENWGLITYRETSILYDPATSSTDDQEWVAITVSHELSHQWFGNLVTMEWWNDLWLNEGFASYMEYNGVNHVYPQWHIWNEFPLDNDFVAMQTDVSRYTHPISVTVDSTDEITAIFDSISYQKGASLIAMMSNFVGDSFFQGITAYLHDHAYGNARNQDLIMTIAEAAKEQNVDFQNMMNTWTTQPGFPVVKVTSVSSGKITITQKRFLYSLGTNEPESKALWQIPIFYITDKNPKVVHHKLLQTKSSSFDVEFDSWIKLNYNESGYFLVTYDKMLWKGLSQQLQADHTVFTPNDRVGLIADAFAAAHCGQLSYPDLFELMHFIRKETKYAVIFQGIHHLTLIKNTLKYNLDEAAYTQMKSFITYLLQPMYDKIAWSDWESLTRDQQKLQSIVIAVMCSNSYQPCVKKALEQYKVWKTDPDEISANDLVTIFNAAVEHGPQSNWDYLWGCFVNSTNAGLQRKIIGSLTLSSQVHNLLTIQSEVLSAKHIRTQDSSTVISGLASNLVGSTITWKFVRQNWNQLTKNSPASGFSMQRIVRSCVQTLIDENEIEAAEMFFNSKSIGEVKFVKRDLESARVTVNWISQYHQPIKDWLALNQHLWSEKRE